MLIVVFKYPYSHLLFLLFRYFEDVKMQVLCKELGNKFNNQGAPKRVEFLMAWVLQVTRNNETIIYGLEPFIGIFLNVFLI